MALYIDSKQQNLCLKPSNPLYILQLYTNDRGARGKTHQQQQQQLLSPCRSKLQRKAAVLSILLPLHFRARSCNRAKTTCTPHTIVVVVGLFVFSFTTYRTTAYQVYKVCRSICRKRGACTAAWEKRVRSRSRTDRDWARGAHLGASEQARIERRERRGVMQCCLFSRWREWGSSVDGRFGVVYSEGGMRGEKVTYTRFVQNSISLWLLMF